MENVTRLFDARRDRVIRQIAALGRPPAGAGGRAAPKPPPRKALELAGLMVFNLQERHSLPRVGLSGGAEIAFLWLVEGARVEAILHPDMALAWFRSRNGEFDRGEMGRDDLGRFPASLLQLIERRGGKHPS